MRFSDGGGVFGFFLGVTMLNCLQTTFEHTLNWSSKIRKRNREKVINISQERSHLFEVLSDHAEKFTVSEHLRTRKDSTHEAKISI